MSFKDLKNNRKNLTEKLKQSLHETSKSGSDEDSGLFWKLQTDKKSGIGEAVIRFLPPSEGEDASYVKLWSHGFQSKLTSKWYIENSLTTLGQEDPVGEMNRELWNTGSEANKNIARSRKRKLNYYSNILVIKDKANPENEGKVFLFRYGPKIFEMIQKQIEPQYDDVESVNVFDFWEGANFRMRAKTIFIDNKPVPNYDDSEFDRPSALLKGDDTKLEALWHQQHSLQEIVSPAKFKSYDDLKKRLKEVLGPEAKNYQLFGGSIENQVTGIVSDSAPTAKAEDIPFDTDDEDTGTSTGSDYFETAGDGLFDEPDV